MLVVDGIVPRFRRLQHAAQVVRAQQAVRALQGVHQRGHQLHLRRQGQLLADRPELGTTARAARSMITMIARRTLGTGPDAPSQSIRAAQADLLDTLPGVRLPDLGDLRARGVLGAHTAAAPGPRRSLGTGCGDDAVPASSI